MSHKITSQVVYLGDLRTESVHLQSGNKIITDAPLDNNGKGEAFSPTDTVATALASCATTIMGIKARDMDLDLSSLRAEVTKTMSAAPRRISGIKIEFYFDKELSDKQKTILERAAFTCPVFQSLNPDMIKEIKFNWH